MIEQVFIRKKNTALATERRRQEKAALLTSAASFRFLEVSRKRDAEIPAAKRHRVLQERRVNPGFLVG